MPAHEVHRVFGRQGELVQTSEIWRDQRGRSRLKTTDSATGQVRETLFQEGQVAWTHVVGASEYRMQWSAGFPPGLEHQLDELDLGAGTANVTHPLILQRIAMLRWVKAPVTVTRRSEEQEGEPVQVVTVRAEPPTISASKEYPHPRPQSIELTFVLDPTMTHVLRYEVVHRDRADGSLRSRLVARTVEEGQKKPDADLFRIQLPPGATVFCEQTKDRLRAKDLVWETITDSEKQALCHAIATLDEGWRTGDFDKVESVFDFGALPLDGRKNQSTAVRRRKLWAGLIKRQHGRWAEWQSRVDYVFAAERPPGLIRISSGMPQMKPGSEEGLTVLALITARERHEQDSEFVRTMYYVRKTDDGYKVIGWRPPR